MPVEHGVDALQVLGPQPTRQEVCIDRPIGRGITEEQLRDDLVCAGVIHHPDLREVQDRDARAAAADLGELLLDGGTDGSSRRPRHQVAVEGGDGALVEPRQIDRDGGYGCLVQGLKVNR